MRCHVCLEPYDEYPGHGKLCRYCREEIEEQQARMRERGTIRSNERIDLEPWKDYLRAFDAFLRTPTTGARIELSDELARVYARKGVEPPANRPDLRPSG